MAQELGAALLDSTATEEKQFEKKGFPRKKGFPLRVIPLFVVANVVVFVITLSVDRCLKNPGICSARFLGPFSFQLHEENNSFLSPSLSTLQKMGALDLNRGVQSHPGWRLLTSMWLHGGPLHLMTNIYGILVIGIPLEIAFGSVVGLLFLISGFGGSLLSALFIRSNISIGVGASGALFGLMGGMLSDLITNWYWPTHYLKLAELLDLVFYSVGGQSLGIYPFSDKFANIGGFLTGFLLGFVFLTRPGYSSDSFEPKFKKHQSILWVLSSILLIVGITVGLVSLHRGVDANDHCSWCHHLACVSTETWGCF